MPFHLDFAPLAGFVALMAVAAFEDFRRLVIPNGVVIGLCVLWPFQLAAAPGASLITGMAAIGCGFAVFFAGALLFSRGLIGGGDVKLLAAATLWAGPGGTLPLLVLTGLLGGLLCLLLLTPAGRLIATARPTLGDPSGGDPGRGAKRLVVPYGVAIAAAALIVTIPPNFN